MDNSWTLKAAALDYALAIEEGDKFECYKAWNKLRKAAIRYREEPRKWGRPKGANGSGIPRQSRRSDSGNVGIHNP
jgi:hypothetical protein